MRANKITAHNAGRRVEFWFAGSVLNQSNEQVVRLELRHIGERLTLRRIKTDNGVEELRLTGSLPDGA